MSGEIIQYVSTNWVAWFFTLLSFVGGYILRSMTKAAKAEQEKQKAMQKAMQALLRDRIIQAYNYHEKKGYCEIYEFYNVERLYEPYHALGGNDVATGLVEKLAKMPRTKPEDNESEVNNHDE